jgi:hypothetical protein
MGMAGKRLAPRSEPVRSNPTQILAQSVEAPVTKSEVLPALQSTARIPKVMTAKASTIPQRNQ